MLSRSLRGLGYLLGAAAALQAIYTAYFGTHDPAYHRPLVMALCVVAALCVRPLAVIHENKNALVRTLCWIIDALLLAIVLVAIQRFLNAAENVENMLIDFSLADQLIALGAVVAMIEFARREFGMGLAMCSALTLAYVLFGSELPGIFRHAGFTLDQVM